MEREWKNICIFLVENINFKRRLRTLKTDINMHCSIIFFEDPVKNVVKVYEFELDMLIVWLNVFSMINNLTLYMVVDRNC